MKLLSGLGGTTALCGLLVSTTSLANTLENKHEFRVGVFDQDIDITGSATPVGRDPLDINFDSLLGLERSTNTLFAAYNWRFTDKWSASFYYSDLKADGRKEAERDFVWNDQEFLLGALVETEFDLETYLVDASYSFVHDERKEFGLGFGLHAFDITTNLTAKGTITGSGNEGTGENAVSSTSLLAPLPNVRAFGTIMFNQKWEGSFGAGWLSLNYEDYEGRYLYFNASTRYWVTPRFALGLSYEVVEIDVTYDDERLEEVFDIELQGPSLFLTYGF